MRAKGRVVLFVLDQESENKLVVEQTLPKIEADGFTCQMHGFNTLSAVTDQDLATLVVVLSNPETTIGTELSTLITKQHELGVPIILWKRHPGCLDQLPAPVKLLLRPQKPGDSGGPGCSSVGGEILAIAYPERVAPRA